MLEIVLTPAFFHAVLFSQTKMSDDENQQQRERHIARRLPYSGLRELHVDNFETISGPATAENMNRFFRSRNMTQHVTIDELICDPEGDHRKKFLFGIIISMTLCSSNQPTTMYARGPNGKKGNSNGTNFRRMIRVFDPTVPPGRINTFTILEGNGHSTRLFSLDLAVRDDGTFREYSLVPFITKYHQVLTFYCFIANQVQELRLWCALLLGSETTWVVPTQSW